MKDDGKSGSSFDLQTALIVLALVGGAYLIPFALRSARPQERKSLERTSLGDQVVPARLWQDPLEVALAYRTNVNRHFSPANPTNGANPRLTIDSFFTLREIASQISRRWTQASSLGPKEPTAVLEVMISGGSYAEDSEERHRTRYAVLSALEVAGYVASDPEHLG